MELRLLVLRGPTSGRSFGVPAGSGATIGRASDCSIPLDDDLVSRRHARIEWSGARPEIVDLGSQNGVAVGGERIVGRAPLGKGSRITIGQHTLIVVACPAAEPTRIGDYVLERLLGEGGAGRVYLARRPGDPVAHAVKVLRPEHADEREVRERFRREIEVSKRLDHPSIVPFAGSGTDGGQLYLASHFVEGPTLADLLGPRRGLDAGRIRAWAIDMAHALAHAHGHRILHRDLKPANVLVGADDDRARILDFGLALALDATRSKLTRTGFSLGTIEFIPPEQLLDAHQATERSDLYGLGATLYSALAGRPPFEADGAPALIRAILGTSPPPLAELCPEAPVPLLASIERAMARRPEDRFASAREMLAALER